MLLRAINSGHPTIDKIAIKTKGKGGWRAMSEVGAGRRTPEWRGKKAGGG
jgi:hypothetical protein